MDFWDRVDRLVSENRTTYTWLASVTGVKESTFSMQKKRGTEARASDAVKIARTLGVSAEYLATGEGPETIPEKVSELVKKISVLDEDDLDDVAALVQSKIDRKQKKRLSELSENMGSAS